VAQNRLHQSQNLPIRYALCSIALPDVNGLKITPPGGGEKCPHRHTCNVCTSEQHNALSCQKVVIEMTLQRYRPSYPLTDFKSGYLGRLQQPSIWHLCRHSVISSRQRSTCSSSRMATSSLIYFYLLVCALLHKYSTCFQQLYTGYLKPCTNEIAPIISMISSSSFHQGRIPPSLPQNSIPLSQNSASQKQLQRTQWVVSSFISDSNSILVQLPPGKQQAINAVNTLLTSHRVTLAGLESTLGFLSHCCQVRSSWSSLPLQSLFVNLPPQPLVIFPSSRNPLVL